MSTDTMIISALDKNTVKLLTTTQIVTSVSSAVKELIENALDANATSIEINLVDNGSSLIEVKDNACGITKENAPFMALSSYTSKITNFSDLETLHTYGFRGEALHALCAVADVTIVTKTEEDDTATSYTMDHGGNILQSDLCHRATGTTVQVKRLFKDIPVRRQIITNTKKAKQEMKLLESLLKSYGICKFSVRFSCRVDKSIIFAKPGMNSVKEAVNYVLGKAITSNMSWIEITESEVSIRLMIPSKDAGSVQEIFQNNTQYIFVNDRPIKHKELEKLVLKTISEGLGLDTSSKKRPVFILFLSTDSSNVDVNLEPNKTSVIFKELQTILDTVDKSLRNFYGIQLEEIAKVDDSNVSVAYQDYTQSVEEQESETVWPACKKRKLELDSIVEHKDIPVEKTNDKSCEKQNNIGRNDANDSQPEPVERFTVNDEGNKNQEESRCNSNKFTNDMDVLTSQFNPPDLSESDSNDTQDFVDVTNKRIKEKDSDVKTDQEVSEDSPAFEFSPSTPAPSVSQLPSVDLGEDFDWEDVSRQLEEKTREKENEIRNANVVSAPKERKQTPKKDATLDAWSKGHVSGLKGGTDVKPYVSTEKDKLPETKSMNESFHKSNTLNGFVLFSRHVRTEIMKENPTLSAPQIGQKITDVWKELSVEERGYYKDLAREKRLEYEAEKRAMKDLASLDAEKNKDRLLKMLENMKKLNVEKKENMMRRTTVPWEVDLQKIAASHHDKSNMNKCFVIGPVSSNLWTVQTCEYIWMFDLVHLREELNLCEIDTGQNNAENVERLLKRWLTEKDDMSLLYPLHSLSKDVET